MFKRYCFSNVHIDLSCTIFCSHLLPSSSGGSAKGGDRLELGKELGGKNFTPSMPGDQVSHSLTSFEFFCPFLHTAPSPSQPGEEAIVGGLRFAALSQVRNSCLLPMN
jgi:hypothetical protein